MVGEYGRKFGEAMRARRTARGGSYADLSARLRLRSVNLPPKALKQIEIGERRVDVDEMLAISTILSLDLTEVLDDWKVTPI